MEEVLVIDALLKERLAAPAVMIILEVDGIKNVYLNFNFSQRVYEPFFIGVN